MRRLDELIKELCPDGVEYKKLGEICITLPKGTLKQSELLDNGYYPVINSGREFYGYYSKCNNEIPAFCIASRGEYAGFVTYINKPFWAGGLCYPYASNNEKILLTKFIYYYLKLKEKYIMKVMVSRGSIPALNKSDIDKISIPLPPIEVQEEIVRILDNFTELTAELTARRKQYEYYRDELLAFDKDSPCTKIKNLINSLCPDGVEYKKLGEICKRLKGTPITAGKMKEIACGGGQIRIFAGGKTVIDTNESEIPNANIIRVPSVLVQSRGIIDFIYYNKPFTFKNEMWAYTHENSTTLKYLYYVLKNNVQHFRNASIGMGAMPQISLPATDDFLIPVPPIEVQEKIVSILDRFDALCNDILEGLPAEIEARKKQYEYYRDKLLTFKEKAVL